MARAFTGWTIDGRARAAASSSAAACTTRAQKTVLGHTLRRAAARPTASRCSTCSRAHPATARFIAIKLARRFVADEPPPALVDARRGAFRDTDGDLREVVRTILTSPEFLAPEARIARR